MTLSDKILLLDLAKKYGAPLEVSGLLARIPEIFEPDLVAISGVLARLSDSELRAVACHPATAEAIRAFVATVDEHLLVVAARLKLGIAVRGLKLPGPIRKAVGVEIYNDGGVLRVRARGHEFRSDIAQKAPHVPPSGPHGV